MQSGPPQDGQVGIREQLLLYQEGNLAAATALVRMVSPMFVRFCLAQGDSREDVEDIVQEIWLRIHKALHTFRPDAAAEPWLYAIARHTRLDFRRRRQRHRSREVQMDRQQDLIAPAVPEVARPLSELLAPLSPGQREVITLLKSCGMTLEEVARATCSTVGAVKQKAHRAYECLRAARDGALLGKTNDL